MATSAVTIVGVTFRAREKKLFYVRTFVTSRIRW